MNENYKRKVVAYLSMYLRDYYADVNEEFNYYDSVYDLAETLADEFIGSDYDLSTKSLFDCIGDFLISQLKTICK